MSLPRWLCLAWWWAPAFYLLLLAAPSVTLPRDDLGIRRFQTPPLGPDLRLGQTFFMTTDGLHALEVFPAVAQDHSGDVRFELYEITDDGPAMVGLAEVSVEDLARAPSYRFEIAPIPHSRDRTYRLDLVAAPAEGVAFWATRGERYAGGSMHANGRARWADLAFRTYAPAPSIWGRLMELRDTSPTRAYLVITLLPAIWLILGVALRKLANIPPELGHTGFPRAT